jgi:uncharacterized protein (TIGR02466 family)
MSQPRSAQFQLQTAFSVPVARAMHPAPEALNRALRALFLEREQDGDRYRNPQPTMNIRPGLFESRFDLFDWTDEPVRELREFCWAALFKTVSDLSGYVARDINTLEVRSSAWFHVTRRGGYFGQHNHPMASWSGVYSVDAGDDRSEHPDSGALVFAHPFGMAAAWTDLGNANLREPWALRPLSLRLKPGELVIFPSWLMHQVMPFQGDGERITVAFNAWFRRRDAGASAA